MEFPSCRNSKISITFHTFTLKTISSFLLFCCFLPLFLVEATKGYLINIPDYSCYVCGFMQEESSTFFKNLFSPIQQ